MVNKTTTKRSKLRKKQRERAERRRNRKAKRQSRLSNSGVICPKQYPKANCGYSNRIHIRRAEPSTDFCPFHCQRCGVEYNICEWCGVLACGCHSVKKCRIIPRRNKCGSCHRLYAQSHEFAMSHQNKYCICPHMYDVAAYPVMCNIGGEPRTLYVIALDLIYEEDYCANCCTPYQSGNHKCKCFGNMFNVITRNDWHNFTGLSHSSIIDVINEYAVAGSLLCTSCNRQIDTYLGQTRGACTCVWNYCPNPVCYLRKLEDGKCQCGVYRECSRCDNLQWRDVEKYYPCERCGNCPHGNDVSRDMGFCIECDDGVFPVVPCSQEYCIRENKCCCDIKQCNSCKRSFYPTVEYCDVCIVNERAVPLVDFVIPN